MSYSFLTQSGVRTTLKSTKKKSEEKKELFTLKNLLTWLFRDIAAFWSANDNSQNDSFVSKYN
jgi:hypothetical protein